MNAFTYTVFERPSEISWGVKTVGKKKLEIPKHLSVSTTVVLRAPISSEVSNERSWVRTVLCAYILRPWTYYMLRQGVCP